MSGKKASPAIVIEFAVSEKPGLLLKYHAPIDENRNTAEMNRTKYRIDSELKYDIRDVLSSSPMSDHLLLCSIDTLSFRNYDHPSSSDLTPLQL